MEIKRLLFSMQIDSVLKVPTGVIIDSQMPTQP